MALDSTQFSKAALRALALARRDTLSTEQRSDAARALALHRVPVALSPDIIVAGFSPVRSEIDPLPLMRTFADQGASLALPVIAGDDQPLIFRAWTADAPLVRGAYGILEPSVEASEMQPDIVLVPLAAFDRAGHRIGYGAGYYDRTLQILRKSKPIIAIGIAFAVQEIADVPSSAHDERLDLVLTERDILDFRDL